jgi:hypothetical protein
VLFQKINFKKATSLVHRDHGGRIRMNAILIVLVVLFFLSVAAVFYMIAKSE